MARRQLYVYVCQNRRDPSNPKGSCAVSGSELVLDKLKELVASRGLRQRVRVMGCDCQDLCAHGPAVSVWPEGVFYGHVQTADCEEIVERHFGDGKVVQRLVLPEDAFG